MKYLKLLLLLVVISTNSYSQTWHRIRKEYDLIQVKDLNKINLDNIEVDTTIGTNFGFKFVAFSKGVPIYYYNDKFYLIKIRSLTYVTGWVTDSLDLIYIDRVKRIKND